MRKILPVYIISLALLFSQCDCNNQLEDDVPTDKASSISFTDTDRDSGQIGGAVTIGKASMEVGITHYVLYWGIGGKKLVQSEPVAEIAKTGKDLVYYIPNNSTAERGAPQLVVYTKNEQGEMDDGIATDIVDVAGGNYKWVVMYYVDADNDLEPYIMADVNEIEAVNYAAKDILVVALIDRFGGGYWDGDGDWGDTRAFELGYDSGGLNDNLSSSSVRISIPELNITSTSTDVELNMGDPDTLEKFIAYCKTAYPADNYMLLMTNHGGGWRDDPAKRDERIQRIVIDKALSWDETNSNDSLTMKEVRQAIYNGAGIASGGSKLSLVAFDACLMGSVEVAYELRDVASYLVASSEEIPGFGFPYTQIFTALAGTDSEITPEYFGKTIIDNYVLAYTNGTNYEYPTFTSNDITLSLTDLSKISTVVSAVNDLGSALDASYLNIDSRLLADSFDGYTVDLYDFANKTSGFDTQTTAVKNALKDGSDPAVVYHLAGPDHVSSNGLSIFFPPTKTQFYNYYADSVSKYYEVYTSAEIQFATAAPNWVTFIDTLGDSALTATDTYEVTTAGTYYGNDLITFANDNVGASPSTRLNCGTATNSYIYYRGDEDYFNILHSSKVSVSLTVPADKDYDLYLYGINSSGTLMNGGVELASSINEGNGVSEDIVYDGANGYPSASYGYYIQIVGYEDAYSSSDTYTVSCTKY